MTDGANTKQMGVSTLQKGRYIVIEGSACVVTDIQISKPGKHGHAKVRLSAVGILDDKKRVIVMPGHDNVDVPIIDKRNAQVLSAHGDRANVMDTETYESFDLVVPEEMRGKLTEGSSVLYWVIMGEKVMKQVKSA